MSNLPVNERIKALRKALKMNQKDFAKVLGLTQTSLSQLELGKHLPKYPVISNLINRLKVNPAYLFKTSETMFSSDIIFTDIADESLKNTEIKPYLYIDNPSSGVAEEMGDYKRNTKNKYQTKDDLLPYNVVPIISTNDIFETGPLIPSGLDSETYIYLPPSLIKKGVYRCIKIENDDLKSFLQKDDYVIIRLVDKSEWTQLPEKTLCVLGDTHHNVYINHIVNQSQKECILLYKQNGEEDTKENIVQYSEIEVIWTIEWCLSGSNFRYLNSYELRMSKIEKEVEDLEKAFQKFKTEQNKSTR